MSTSGDSERTPAERVEDLPRILAAMAEAVREALLRHKLLGNPIAVWRDGRVVWLAPEEIPVDIVEPGRERAWRLSGERAPSGCPAPGAT